MPCLRKSEVASQRLKLRGRSMDNIAVMVVDVRPPGAVERSESASTEVEVLSSSEPDGVSVGHIVSSEGASD